MAQQSINFRGRTIGSFPDDLLVDKTAGNIDTKEIVFNSAIDDTVFQLESGGDGTAVTMQVRSDVLALQDGEIFFRFHVDSGFQGKNDGGFSFRGETDPGFTNSWAVRTGENRGVFVDGSQVSTLPTDFRNWNNALVVLNGDSVQIKIWSINDPEPGDFTVTLTNATLQNESLISVLASSSRGGVLMDFIGIGTDGDSAPREPVGDDTSAPQNLSGEQDGTSIIWTATTP